MNKKVAELKTLLAKNRTDSLLKHLITIVQANGDTQLYNEVTQLQGILYKAEQDFSAGRVNKEAYDVQIQRSKNGLLNVIDLCEELGYLKSITRTSYLLGWKRLNVVGVVLFLLLWVLYPKFDKPDPHKGQHTRLPEPVSKDTGYHQKTETVQTTSSLFKSKSDPALAAPTKPSQSLMVVKITVDAACRDSTIYLDGKVVYAREVGLLFKYLSVVRGQTHELLIAGKRQVFDAPVDREDTLSVLVPCY